jgi:ribosome biogenesis protein Nip4
MFSTTADWLTHMQWEHTLQWRCNARGHPPQTFGREQDFEDHMRISHAGTFSEPQLPLLKRRSAQPAPETFFSCPLCGYLPSECSEELGSGKKSEDLPNHVAAHLQDIALVSLPWRGDLEEIASSNTTSAPRARDSVLGLHDERSLSSFEDTPPELTDDTEPINEAQVGTPDRGLGEHEWAFIMLPHYEGHTTDPILVPFMSKFEQVINLAACFAASVPIQDLIYLTGEIVNYIKDTLGKSEMREKLLKELESVSETLLYIKRRLEAAQPADAFLQRFVETAKPVEGLPADGTTLLYGSFAQLRRCLEIIKDAMTPKSSIRKLLGEQIWPFPEDQAGMLLHDLSRVSVHIRSILFQDEFTLSSSGIEDSLSIQEETSYRKLYESLSPLDFTVTQEHIFRGSLRNGNWFLETQEFKAWVSGRPWTLYVFGNPGVGKVDTPFNLILITF